MNIKLLYTLSLTILTTFFSFSQTPCVGGKAGSYPCNGYDLMSNINISTLSGSASAEGADIWGWTDPTTNKEYAIASMTNSTAFVDITDPVNPIYLGRLNTNAGSNFWRDVKVYKNHAFIVADNVGAHGMQVFDLTRLRGVTTPQNFTSDTVFTGVNSCHNIVINEATGYAYLVGCGGFYSGGPVFVDITDPKNPKAAGGYSAQGYTHDAQVVTYNGPDTDYTGREILIASNGNVRGTNDVVVVDVTNKTSPKFISKITYPNARYTHQGWFTEDQSHFILGDELDEQSIGTNTKSVVFDLTDLDAPKISSTYLGPTAAIDHNGYVKGNEFFIANYTAGLRVLDISNISASTNAMVETGYFDTYPEDNSTSFKGVWSVYPYFASGNIILNDINRGLFVVRKSGTLSTDNIDLTKSKFTIFPNPSNKTTNPRVIAQNNTINSIEVYNILGKRVFLEKNISQKEFTIPMKKEAKGVYIIKINNKISKKLILR